MAKVIGKLSAVTINKFGPGYYGDGGGLWLQVSNANTRSWVMRFTLKGKRREMGLGATHTVSLAQAREATKEARLLLLKGIDPIEARNDARKQEELAKSRILTFDQCCEKYINTHKSSWKNPKHTAQWTNTLKTYCESFLDTPVSDVGRHEVLTCLEKIWESKNETATRLRGRIESVLDWAKVHGYRSGDNPAAWKGCLDHLLPTISKSRRVQHHRALAWTDISDFMTRLRQEEGLAAKALEFLILTASRSGEVRGATWNEIDLSSRMWVIPANRMKMEREHRIPLSDSAILLLKQLPRSETRDKAEDLVFSSGNTGKMLSDMALTAVLRRMQIDAVPHGFRSTFRDWAGESTNYPREVCEHALAHRLASGVEAAYQRGDMLKKRAAMMADWAKHCFPSD